MDARTAWTSTEVLDQLIANRWASLGPYYAMFPIEFARKVITNYTSPGDLVLDPFCGRGTSIFCAGEGGRNGLGIEINPVGWLYARVKINPAPRKLVERRLAEISQLAGDSKYLQSLPRFFRNCY